MCRVFCTGLKLRMYPKKTVPYSHSATQPLCQRSWTSHSATQPEWLDQPLSHSATLPEWLDQPLSHSATLPEWLDQPLSHSATQPLGTSHSATQPLCQSGWIPATQPLSHSARVAGPATQPLSQSGWTSHSATQPLHSARVAGPATQPLSHSPRVAGPATQPLSHSPRVAGPATQPLSHSARVAGPATQSHSGSWGDNFRHCAFNLYFNPPKNCTTCNFPCTAVLLVKIGCPRDIAHGDSRTGPTLSTDRPNLPAGRRCLRRSGKAWHPITHGGGWAGSTDGYEQQWIEITVTQH